MAENEKQVKMLFVCGFCRHHSYDGPAEFNFYEGTIYYSCHECKKMNVLKLSKDQPPPYPRIGIGR